MYSQTGHSSPPAAATFSHLEWAVAAHLPASNPAHGYTTARGSLLKQDIRHVVPLLSTLQGFCSPFDRTLSAYGGVQGHPQSLLFHGPTASSSSFPSCPRPPRCHRTHQTPSHSFRACCCSLEHSSCDSPQTFTCLAPSLPSNLY